MKQSIHLQLRNKLVESMKKSFPLEHTTSLSANPSTHLSKAKSKPIFDKLVHMQSTKGFPRKTTDYFSTSPQLIFNMFVSKKDIQS